MKRYKKKKFPKKALNALKNPEISCEILIEIESLDKCIETLNELHNKTNLIWASGKKLNDPERDKKWLNHKKVKYLSMSKYGTISFWSKKPTLAIYENHHYIFLKSKELTLTTNNNHNYIFLKSKKEFITLACAFKGKNKIK